MFSLSNQKEKRSFSLNNPFTVKKTQISADFQKKANDEVCERVQTLVS